MSIVVILFFFVYLGLMIGNLPGFGLDRTGVVLLASLLLIVSKQLNGSELLEAVDWSTMAILFGLMLVSAQLYFSGFYTWVIEKIDQRGLSAKKFLLYLVLVIGLLSSIILNDILCLALTPLVIEICQEKRWDPKPMLLGVAAAANTGSVMTLIGNPQNILISEALNLPFFQYFLLTAPPACIGLIWIWKILSWQTARWGVEEKKAQDIVGIKSDPWQIAKGVIVLIGLVLFFFFSSYPRAHLVLWAAALLLLSRKMTSEKMLGFVDWQLLVLFGGLFVVNAAVLKTAVAEEFLQWLQTGPFSLTNEITLYLSSAVLSNIISNVPASMLLLPFAKNPLLGTTLAVSSTLAGNLLLTGSIANLIVVMKAKSLGVTISWKEHVHSGIWIFLGTSILSVIWLWGCTKYLLL